MANKEEDLYSGFFLGLLPTKLNGKHLIKVACFKPGTKFRRVLELAIETKREYLYGALIHFQSQDGELKQHSCITIKENPQDIIIHDTGVEDKITHTIKDLAVGAENLPNVHVYVHPDLDEMIDEGSIMKPARYVFVTFQVELTNDDKFVLRIEGGQALEKNDNVRAPQLSDTDRLETVHELIKIENDHNKMVESNAWAAIGRFTLIGYDNSDTDGLQPIFELCDNKHLELFRKQNDNCTVVIAKQIEVDGEWKFDESAEPVEGTLNLHKENMNQAIALLKRDYRLIFDLRFKEGEKFIFTSGLTDKTLPFWLAKTHLTMKLFTESQPEKVAVEKLGLQQIIEDHQIATEELNKISDRGTLPFNLNPTQFKAIKMALNEKRKLVCIQGPPGTGKTFVLATLLVKLIEKKKKALVLTPTKEALKNIRAMTERMLTNRKVKFNDNTLMDVEKLREVKNSSHQGKDTIRLREGLRIQLQNGEIEEHEYLKTARAVIDDNSARQETELISGASVIFATIESGFVERATRHSIFDPCMCIIDEAAQVKETQVWPAVMKMKKIVMAGDPKQLPALVMTTEGKEGKLNHSVMDRIIEHKDKFSWIMLDEQYRCHPAIIEWSNGNFYGGNLKNKTSEGNKLHNKFKIQPPSAFTSLFAPFAIIDTSLETRDPVRTDTYEQYIVEHDPTEPGKFSASYGNLAEAQIVATHYRHLRDLGIEAKDIAIITPYRGQLDLLDRSISSLAARFPDYKATKIGTIDSVQGQEWDVVIFSMVRSNPKLTLGFVSDLRRLNVVVTRAKLHFMLVGNGYMLASSQRAEIRNLFDTARPKHRFHPEHASYSHDYNKNYTEVSNNFGNYFDLFLQNTNDPQMKEYIINYKKKGEERARNRARLFNNRVNQSNNQM